MISKRSKKNIQYFHRLSPFYIVTHSQVVITVPSLTWHRVVYNAVSVPVLECARSVRRCVIIDFIYYSFCRSRQRAAFYFHSVFAHMRNTITTTTTTNRTFVWVFGLFFCLLFHSTSCWCCCWSFVPRVRYRRLCKTPAWRIYNNFVRRLFFLFVVVVVTSW